MGGLCAERYMPYVHCDRCSGRTTFTDMDKVTPPVRRALWQSGRRGRFIRSIPTYLTSVYGYFAMFVHIHHICEHIQADFGSILVIQP